MNPTKTYTIYLIEEDEKQSAYLRGAIIDTDEHCDVEYFSDGKTALKYLQDAESESPDMILLSISLKNIDSFELIK